MEIKPLYFLAVQDDYRAERFIAGLAREIFPPGRADINRERIFAAAAPVAEIIASLRTPSLFGLGSAGPGKLVIVEEAEKIAPPEWKALAPALSAPLKELCLVFVFRPERISGWKPPLQTGAAVKIIRLLKEEQLKEWIVDEARSLGLTLRRKAADELVSIAGTDLGRIRGELEKLSLYLGRGEEAGPEEIRKLAGGGGEGDIFALLNKIFAGDAAAALPMLRARLRAGEAPLRLLHHINRKTVEIWLGREAWERERSDSAACRAAGVRYYRGEFLRLVRNIPSRRFPFIIHRIREADLALKGGEKNAELALQRLVCELSAPG